MEEPTLNQTCSCPCGKSKFQALAYPFARFICHCSICQQLYKSAFADATVLWWRDILIPKKHDIQFKKYRAFPGLNRGVCSDCKSPVIASMGYGPARIAITSAQNFPNISELLAPQMHIFYDKCQSKINDKLPKYSGYLSSEIATTNLILRGMFCRNK